MLIIMNFESIGSSALPTRVPHPTPVVDLESKPFEDPASPVDSDSDSFENPPNLDPLEDRVSPIASIASDSNDEPHGLPYTSDYFGRSNADSDPEEFSEDPSEDDPTNASSRTDEPHAQIVPAPQTSPLFNHDMTIARRVVTSPTLPPSPSSPLPSYLSSPAHSGPSRKRSRPSPSPSAGTSRKRCWSHIPAALIAVELALVAALLPSIPIELLLPRKRFGALDRIETAKREIESLRARLAAAEIHIVAHQRDEICRDIREVGYRACLKRIEDTLHRDR
ncbi:hypothetical protein Tco_0804222 [Tanacetum coccineum]|uniref:Uncharacterized protein n=1 Tax=Tanacetum coccineum TaxID=301880 RepID=A0ABQ5A3R4_9ASTR